MKITAILASLSLTLLFTSASQGVTFNWATIGNPGNAADDTGLGSVADEYRISTTEVTNGQFSEFLNSVDPGGLNDLGLYNEGMTTDSGRGGITLDPLATSGNHYGIKSGRGDWPINYVAWWDAIRFINWLDNGQGTGDTETGAYDIGPLNSESEPANNGVGISRSIDATWILPTDDQWYKAAFHKNDGVTDNYWDYHYGSDAQPIAEGPSGGSNSANYSFAVGTVSEVGSYFSSSSPYGTFDQSGNVEEWTETTVPSQGGARRLANGSWRTSSGSASNAFQLTNAAKEKDEIGFRVASIFATLLTWNQLGPGTFGFETAANWTPSQTPLADTDVVFPLDGDVDVVPFSTSVAKNVTFSDGVVRLKSLGTTTFSSHGSVTVDDPLAANLGDGAFATLDGTNGHAWTTSFNLQVGDTGYGTFIVNNGGDFDAQQILIGNQDGAEGELTVAGVDSTIAATLNTDTSLYRVGSGGGTGTMNVQGGASVNSGGLAGDVSLGEGLGSSGTLNVDGPGSNAVMDDLLVGVGGVGFMNVTGGGLVDQTVGSEPDAQIAASDLSANLGAGTVVVNGDDSRWNLRRGVFGSAGLGSVAVEAGGRIAATADVTVGLDSTSQGSLQVTGVGTLADSQVSVGGDLIVGKLGQGTVNVDLGGDLTVDSNLFVGDDPSNLNNNAVTITDPGSSLTVTERLEVGREGMGTLNVTGGGTTSSQALVAGQSLGSTGIITLSGVGSSATAVGTGIGTFGTGSLTISAGAHLDTARLWVGFADDSDSTVDINGTGSTLTVTGLNQLPVSLRIGGHDTLEGGTGTVTISAGGTIVAGRETRIGTSLGSVGSLTVTGPTSLADFNDGGTDNTTVVGHAGDGTLSILDGGRVESNIATIGQLAGSNGTVDVGNGNAPANWNVGGSLYVGGSASAAGGTGRLNINSQGTVTVADELKIWDDGEFFLSGGTLNVGNGFALDVGSSLNGTGSINAETSQALGSNIIASGNLTVGDSNSVAGFFSDGEMQVNNHTVTLNDSDQAVLGSLTRIGSGGADGVLSASNGILLEAGKTLVGRGEVTTSNDEFSSQGFVQGEGVGITFNHLVTGEGAFGGQVAFEGGYSPGNSAALVELENVEFGSANVLTIELGGLDRGTEYDALDVSGLINIDGILHAQLIDSFVPSLGNVFEVIAFGGRTGDFTTYSGLDLGNGTALLPEFTVDSLLLTVVVPTEPEDLNMDGFVDSLDLGILLGNWGLSVPPVGGELDARPPIDGQDLGILLGAWDPPPLPGTSVVPEPSALLLGAMASVALMLRRRR